MSDEAALRNASGQHAHMMTRRTALGAGLALASVASIAGFGAYDRIAQRRREVRPIDALLVDHTIEMPHLIVAFVEASRRTLDVVGIRLDAATQAGLMRVLDTSHAIVGISSGATLFCLERIAWDHGFRLTARSERHSSERGADACRQDVAAFLGGVHPPAACRSALVRAYRPSRADGTLHAWVMQKSSGHRLSQGHREARP